MVLSAATHARAAAMGKRAGQAYADTGLPTRNPFDRKKLPDLAQDWGHAYLAASPAPPRPPTDPDAAASLTAAAAGGAAPPSGVAIMAVLADSDAAKLTVPGAAAPDAPGFHLTLGSLAEPAASFNEAARTQFVAALAAESTLTQSMTVDVFGQAVLNDDDGEREPALVALVQSDDAAFAHDAVTAACASAKIDLSDTFPVWLAHVTIGYNLAAADFPAGLVGQTLTLDRVVVAWGDDIVTVDPAGDTGPAPMTAAVEAPVTAPTTTAPAPSDVAAPSATGGDTAATGDLTPQGLTWQGPIAMLDTPSSDNRIISSTGGTIRPLPQPLNWQRESDDGHEGSTKVGRILAVEQRGTTLWASGDWLDPMVNFDAQQAMAEVDAGLGFVSVDLAVLAEAYAAPDGTLIDPDFAPGNPDEVYLAAVAWELGGATLVSFAAFRDARIENDSAPDVAAADPGGPALMPPMPGDGQFAADDTASITLPSGDSVSVGDDVVYPDPDDESGDGMETGTITAIDTDAQTVSTTPKVTPDDPGAVDDPPRVGIAVSTLTLPTDTATPGDGAADAMLTASSELLPYTAANFAERELDGPTPISYDPATGAVFGHIGQWGQCHVGKLAETGKCVTIPEAPGGDYSHFELTPVHTDDGSLLMAGRLTVGTGHAGPHGGVRAALAHYDNSGAQVALVKTYEDAYGVQVAGQVIHGTPPERIEEMLRSPMSGDWRLVDVAPGSPLRLVAALGVNVPGFPVVPKWGMSGGRQVSLVAAGVVRPPELSPGLVPLPNGQSMASDDFGVLVAAVEAAMERRAAKSGGDDAQTRLRLARARLALSA